MKDFMKTLGLAIAIVIVSVVATLAIIQVTGSKFLPKTFDSSVQTAQTDMQGSVSLNSLTDVFQLRQSMMDESRIDSTFLAIDDGPLSNVTSVLLKRNGFTTKDDIVNEYLAGRSVYDNLPPPDGSKPNATTTETDPIANVSLVKEGVTTVREGPPTGVGDTSSPSSKDTLINGKRYKQIE